jgi:hypothetical protein
LLADFRGARSHAQSPVRGAGALKKIGRRWNAFR